MKIKAGRNSNEVGIERVDRDGEVSVVKDGDVEVSVDERMDWYNKATVDSEREIETEESDGGNSMARNEKMRTSLPRPGEYSIERRMQEERDPGSTTDVTSDVTLQQAMGKAFCMVAPIVMSNTALTPVKVASISAATGVDVVDVLRLETIAFRNRDLARKAIATASDIPGVVEDEGGQLIKESEPEAGCEKCKRKSVKPVGPEEEVVADDELAKIGTDCGLCE